MKLGCRELSSLHVDRPVVFALGDIGIALFVATVYYRFIQIPAIKNNTHTNTSRNSETLNELCCQLIFGFKRYLIFLAVVLFQVKSYSNRNGHRVQGGQHEHEVMPEDESLLSAVALEKASTLHSVPLFSVSESSMSKKEVNPT